MSPDTTKWQSPRRFAVGYAIAILALILNAAYAFWSLSTIQTTWDALGDSREFARGIDKVLSDLNDAEASQRGFLLTGDERYLEPYMRSHAVISAEIEQLRALPGKDSSRQARLDAMSEASATKLADLEKGIAARRRDGLEAAIAVVRSGRGWEATQRVRRELAAMQAEQDAVQGPLRQQLETANPPPFWLFERAAPQGTLRRQLQTAITRTMVTFTLASALALALLFGAHFLRERSRHEVRRYATWLSTTLRSIGDGVIATDTDGRVIFMNAIAEKLTGWTQDEARAKPLQAIFRITNESTGNPLENPVDRVLRQGSSEGLSNHTLLIARDGTERPIEDSAAPIREGERVLGVVLAFRDASAARLSQSQLRQSEERYRSLVAAMTQTVWMTSPDFGSSVTLTGKDPIGVPDRAKKAGGWLSAIHPGDRQRTKEAFDRASRSKAVYEVEHRVKSPTGDYRHYLVRAVPLLDSAGKIREWIGTSSDITERRQAEKARERLYLELQENNKRKDEFLAMLAHELRNPLAAIANAVILATRSGPNEHVDWSMQVIDRQIKHLTRLIDDLLDVSRITRGKIELHRHLLDATPILDSAVQTVRPLVDERKHKLSVALDRGKLWLNADPTRLEQVVTNLLTNAAKYTENGGQISLSSARAAGDIVITVKDTGVGIPPEKLPEMFELFAQGDRTLARSEGGLGIGLTIVKKLVEAHGGSITAKSEGTNKGSEFTVRLPAATPPATVNTLIRGPAQPTSRPARILVVDDNVDLAKGLARLLKLIGHDVTIAHDGPAAIETARRCHPEFILLDIGLPGMDGYEVASLLRREPSCHDTVLIAISGYGQDEDRRHSQQAGFDHHFVKPIDHDALLTVLATASGSRWE